MRRYVFLLSSIIPVVVLSVLMPGCDSSQTDTTSITGQNPDKDDPEKEDPENPGPSIGNGIRRYNAPHYVLSYIGTTGFTAYANPVCCINILSDGNGISRTRYTWWDIRAERFSEKTEIYEERCKYYDDLLYDQDRGYIDYYSGGYDYLLDNIVAIDIISATDYDAEHPAGTSLGDICVLRSASPLRYIASGYKEVYDWSAVPEYFDGTSADRYAREGNYPVAKLLEACAPEDFVLMGNGYELLCDLVFIAKPTSGIKQRFIITLTDEQSRTYTAVTQEVQW